MPQINGVTLPGTRITTTALGYGCSGLLGDKTPQEGRRLLDVAYEEGIRHFDVARYYGYGDAEGIVGAFAADKREQITITTKFGLQPMKQVAQSKSLIRLVRKMMRFSPLVRRVVRRKVSSVVERGCFDAPAAKECLHTSLRELKTEYIDMYLLHEAGPQDCQSSELLAFLEQAQNEGKIRGFGVGSAFERVEAICAAAPAYSNLIQFESSILNRNAHKAPRLDARLAEDRRAVITHGSFEAISLLNKRFSQDARYAKRCSDLLGCNCADARSMANLCIQQALRDNPEGIVLFRTSQPARIGDNARAAVDLFFADEQLDRFCELGAELAANPAGQASH